MAVLQRFMATGLFARAMRGSLFSAGGQIIGLGVRLASNLLLTRLLFPEAFGVMALVQMVLMGVQLMSDFGLQHAIGGNKRGDDPDFLNTAWTLQVARGVILWLVCCALALPIAQVYGAPELAVMLPVAGLSLLITGLITTRFDTAVRHLALGQVTLIELTSQLGGILIMVVLAYLTRSVWALVWGGVATSVIKVVLAQVWLPGLRNRPRWEKSSATALLRFGSWTFLSSTGSFALMQGDKAILGIWLSLQELGVYNVAVTMASVPTLLFVTVVGRVFVPLYRGVREDGTPAARAKLQRLRFGLTGVILTGLAILALTGVPLMGWLYDARYAAAGAIVVIFACAQMPIVIMGSYDYAALSNGDSRGMFIAQGLRAVAQSLALLIGVQVAGILGALIGYGVAAVLCLPCGVWLARKHGVHDARHDLVYLGLGAAITALAVWIWAPELALLWSAGV